MTVANMGADARPQLPVALRPSESLARRAVRTFVRNRAAVAGLVVLVVMAAVAAVPSVLPIPGPFEQDLTRRLRPPAWEARGTLTNLFGTDQLGRDILSRLVLGARVSLGLGIACSLLSAMGGVALGLIAGLGSRRTGEVIMRLSDAQQAFPFLVLAIVVIAVFGSGFVNLVILLSVFGWVGYARVVRANVLSLREQEFILAARAIGSGIRRIATMHMLPNVLSPVIVIWTFSIAQIIIVESSLSFLGLGIQPPTPSWGGMLSDGRGYIDSAWWLGVFPGMAIMITVLSVNFVGDTLRDALDPRFQP